MRIAYLKKYKILFSLWVPILSLFFSTGAYALEVTADTCSYADVQAAVDQVEAAGGGTVNIPAGNCTWSEDVDIEGGVSIIGAGMDKTILSLDPSAGLFFEHTQIGDNFVRYSGIRFEAINRSSSATAISLKYPDNFHIDNCYLYGRWYAAISMKMVQKGLIDHVTIEDNDSYESYPYGIAVGSPTTDTPSCGDWSPDCVTEWDAWYDNTELHHGVYFDEDYIPGTDNAVFVEDCHFINGRTNIIGNWGSIVAFTVRHNTFEIDNAEHGQLSQKPGTIFVEAYDNTFTYTGSGNGPRGFYTRSSGLIYDNTFNRMGTPGVLEAFIGGYGYTYTPQTIMDELYIYDNTYNNCTNSGDNSNGWPESSQGNPELIAEDSEYFFRAPQSGDRIYPYTPYPYPHPLASTGTPTGDGGPGDSADGGEIDSGQFDTADANCDCHTAGGTSPAFFVLLLVALLF